MLFNLFIFIIILARQVIKASLLDSAPFLLEYKKIQNGTDNTRELPTYLDVGAQFFFSHFDRAQFLPPR